MTGSVQTIHYICFLGAPDLLMASFNVSIGFGEHFLYKKVQMFLYDIDSKIYCGF